MRADSDNGIFQARVPKKVKRMEKSVSALLWR